MNDELSNPPMMYYTHSQMIADLLRNPVGENYQIPFDRRVGIANALDQAQREVRIAAGMLSTFPPYSSHHPEAALSAIKGAARGVEPPYSSNSQGQEGG